MKAGLVSKMQNISNDDYAIAHVAFKMSGIRSTGYQAIRSINALNERRGFLILIF